MTKFNLPAFHWRIDGTLAGPEIDPAMPIGRALAVRVEFIDTKADLERGFATLKAAAWPSTSIIPLRRPLPSPRRRLAAGG